MDQVYGERRARLRTLLAARGLDALLVSSLVNVRYLTRLRRLQRRPARPGRLARTPCWRPTRATPSRRPLELPDVEVLTARDTGPALAAARGAAGGAAGWATRATRSPSTASATCSTPRGSAALARAERPVEQLREVKDDAEVAALRAACAVADAAFADVLPVDTARASPSATLGVRPRGADAPARRRGAELRHHRRRRASTPRCRTTGRPTGRSPPGDLVKFDFGATVDGYHSDMTRTVVLGEPAAWQREIYDLVAAVAAGRCRRRRDGRGDGRRRPGRARAWSRPAAWASASCTASATASGSRSTSCRRSAPAAPACSRAGMVVTVEPGVYLAGPRRSPHRGHPGRTGRRRARRAADAHHA